MNIAKHMEALFSSAAILVCLTSIASAAAPNFHHAKFAQVATVTLESPVPVVTITAKRLTSAQKAAI